MSRRGPQCPVEDFEVVQTVTRESRRSDREIWRVDTAEAGSVIRTTLVTLTRRQLAQLIAEAADWLAYISDDE